MHVDFNSRQKYPVSSNLVKRNLYNNSTFCQNSCVAWLPRTIRKYTWYTESAENIHFFLFRYDLRLSRASYFNLIYSKWTFADLIYSSKHCHSCVFCPISLAFSFKFHILHSWLKLVFSQCSASKIRKKKRKIINQLKYIEYKLTLTCYACSTFGFEKDKLRNVSSALRVDLWSAQLHLKYALVNINNYDSVKILSRASKIPNQVIFTRVFPQNVMRMITITMKTRKKKEKKKKSRNKASASSQ